MDTLKRYWRDLHESIYVGVAERVICNVTAVVAVVITLFALVSVILNVATGRREMMLSGVVFTFCGAIATWLSAIKRSRFAASLLILVTCALGFTYYAIQGSNNGFAILWVMLLPLGTMYFCDVIVGVYASLLFELLFVVLFWSPLSAYVSSNYTTTFVTHFPILFLLNVIMSACAMIEYHLSALGRLRIANGLHDEVERLTRKDRERLRQMELMSEEAVQTLATVVDAKDRYTQGHSHRVAEYSVLLARELGLPEDEVNVLRLEALLHDVGKIGIPDTILNKPGSLTEIEYGIIQSHTEQGADILSHASTIPGAKDVALSHHERYDGKGYPHRLSGEEIPPHARLVCVCDAYDAMRSDRIYRDAIPIKTVRERMVEGRGAQFDPTYLDAFIRLLDGGALAAVESKQVVESPLYSDESPDSLRMVDEFLSHVVATDKRNAYSISRDEFAELCACMRTISRCQGRELTPIMVSLRPRKGASVNINREKNAVNAMELAIRKTANTEVICATCSQTQTIALFPRTEGQGDVKVLMEHVFSNFYKIFDGSEFELDYEVFEAE